MTKPNIALCGRTGSGKTTIAQYLASEKEYSHCTTGWACRKISQILYKSESKQHLNAITDALKTLDENIWLKVALNTTSPNNSIVFDSMRFHGDYIYLKSKGFILLQVISSLETRIKRLRLRGQEYSPETDELYRGEYELQNYTFDYVIENDEISISGLHEKVNELLITI